MEMETDTVESGVTQEGVSTNNKARLMYYLDTVCSLLTVGEDPEIKRLRQFREYSLSEHQIHRLISLCDLFKPSALMDKCIFHCETLSEGEAIKFLDISAAKSHMNVEEWILIGEKRRKINKIATFKMEWISYYWSHPMQALQAEMKYKTQNSSRICTML